MTATRNEDNQAKAKDRDRELERTIRDALVLAVGRRAANHALRRARSQARGAARHQLGRVALHLAGYGTLLPFIWHQRRTPKNSAA